MLDRLGIAAKLAILTITMLLLLVIVGGMGIVNAAKLADQTNGLHEHPVTVIQGVGKAEVAFRAMRTDIRDAILASQPADFDRIQGSFDRNADAFLAGMAVAKTAFLGDTGNFDDVLAAFAVFRAACQDTISNAKGGDKDAALVAMRGPGGAASVKTMIEKMKAINEVADRRVDDFVGHANGLYAAVVAMTGAMLALSLALGGLVAWALSRSVTAPIGGLTRAMRDLADGRLATDIPHAEAPNEVGEMARAVQVFKANAVEQRRLQAEEKESQDRRHRRQSRLESLTGEFDQAVSSLLSEVSQAAQRMEATAQAMSANATTTQRQSAAVSAATEQASANVGVIAEASNQLLASIGAIGEQVGQSSRISTEAAREAQETNRRIEGLAAAASRVGEVVSMITDIANQTNLLALNATIEAARAGDAGKGFAVVAGEVKHLANQTAKATEEIAAQIGAIQSETQEAVAVIRRITRVIGDISDMSAAISGSVEQQGAALTEVVRNVEEAAAGTGEVARSIVAVVRAADDTGEIADQARQAAASLAGQSDVLRRSVEGFLSGVKAA
jgi:methyl-accepting chemotaxis protein